MLASLVIAVLTLERLPLPGCTGAAVRVVPPRLYRCPPAQAVLGVGGPSDDDEDDEEDDSAPFGSDEELLDELESQLDIGGPAARRSRSRRATPRRARQGREEFRFLLDGPTSLFSELKDSYDEYTERPSQQFLLGSLALLVGFFVSHGQVLGGGDQGGRWEYVSGAVAVLVVERVSRGYYQIPMKDRSPTLRLLNAFKVGFCYGRPRAHASNPPAAAALTSQARTIILSLCH